MLAEREFETHLASNVVIAQAQISRRGDDAIEVARAVCCTLNNYFSILMISGMDNFHTTRYNVYAR